MIDTSLLKDIREIDVRGETVSQKWNSYLSQIGNPYHFRVGKTPVRIFFKTCEETLDRKIRTYFLGLKS